jgi:hypothetical protein
MERIDVTPDGKLRLAFRAHRAPFRESPGRKRVRRSFLCIASMLQLC